MKKLLSLTVISILTLTSINAQDIRYGAKAGVNFASITEDEDDDIESRLSFHVGGFAEFMISEKFYFQPELIYSSQGWKSELSLSGNFGGEKLELEAESIIKLDYINIPLMGKIYVTEGLSLEVGPQIGFLLSATDEFDEIFTRTVGGETIIATDSGSDDIKDSISGVDFGANIGLGYRLENGLLFGARYNFGLSNINSSSEADDFKPSNRVIQISVGYTL